MSSIFTILLIFVLFQFYNEHYKLIKVKISNNTAPPKKKNPNSLIACGIELALSKR